MDILLACAEPLSDFCRRLPVFTRSRKASLTKKRRNVCGAASVVLQNLTVCVSGFFEQWIEWKPIKRGIDPENCLAVACEFWVECHTACSATTIPGAQFQKNLKNRLHDDFVVQGEVILLPRLRPGAATKCFEQVRWLVVETLGRLYESVERLLDCVIPSPQADILSYLNHLNKSEGNHKPCPLSEGRTDADDSKATVTVEYLGDNEEQCGWNIYCLTIWCCVRLLALPTRVSTRIFGHVLLVFLKRFDAVIGPVLIFISSKLLHLNRLICG